MKLAPLFSACLVACTIASAPALAQKCNDKVAETTPVSRFKDNGDGTIADTRTKTVWQRCVVGMKWNGESCEGQSLDYKFSETIGLVDDFNARKMGNRGSWRLPTQAELESIVEPRCFDPSINLEVFPYTPQSGFWTSTEDPGLNSVRIKVVHFYNGNTYTANKKQSWRVRLVADR